MGREAAVMDWEQKFPSYVKRTRGLADWRRRKDDASVCAVGVLHGEGWRVLTATTTHIRKPVNVPWIAVNEEEKTAWRMPEKSAIVSGSREPTS